MNAAVDPVTTPTIRIIDSHTAGEPTRVVVAGAPDLGAGSMAERLAQLRERHDWLRTALVCEPRGAEWMVGAVLQKPIDSSCVAGVIFFNNAGYLGMCGHGTIGVVETLRYQRAIGPGWHRLETPVGIVRARLDESGEVAVENVPCRRTRRDVEVTLPNGEVVVGDVAWGGNWFFLTSVGGLLRMQDVDELTAQTKAIRRAIESAGIVGDDGAPIDHIELVGPPENPRMADARNFVLCPGGLYDRSPCGTGLSAKLACLAADGLLKPGEVWRQESIIGSLFAGAYQLTPAGIVPTITGRAFVNGECTLVIDPQDPFRYGMPSIAGTNE
jgi:4-hydroxyproline epimerase